MNLFVNRESELEFLNNEYRREGSSLVVLYGRRRVGKTRLAVEFMKGKNALYFLASEESEQQNLFAFKDMVGDFTGSELLKEAALNKWDIIFKTLVDYAGSSLTNSGGKGKLVVTIDEFQYLGKANSAFPSVFQRIWDTLLKDNNIMVILCGSLISMMESQVLSYSSPLYGRRTGQIKLKQVPFSHYHRFFPEKGFKDLVMYYAVTGGVPKYIELFYDDGDIYRAIEKNILSKNAFLYDEPKFLLQHEVSEVGSYFSVIRAIAEGNRKLSKIAGALEVKQTGLSKYLKTLIDLDILEREVPVTEKNPEKSKRGLYRINDNYLHFWFRFVYPYKSYLESGNQEFVMDRIRSYFAESHVSYIYEDVCRAEMWRMNEAGQWSFIFDKVGRWWDKDHELDILALDGNGNNIVFGECKFRRQEAGIDVLTDLEQKAQYVEWNKGKRTENFIIFSVSGFTEGLVNAAAERGNVVLMR